MKNAAATIEPMFRRLDADRDGFLSLAEYRKSFPQTARRRGREAGRTEGEAADAGCQASIRRGRITPEQEQVLRGEDPARAGDAMRQVPREHGREAAGRAPRSTAARASARAATPARRSCPATPTRAC